MKARNKLYPKVSGISMNAVDHPYGTSRSSKKGHPTIADRNAPPGRKVGKIRPRRTGMKR
jgi:large subunit ribosomal protein L2